VAGTVDPSASAPREPAASAAAGGWGPREVPARGGRAEPSRGIDATEVYQ
jgi:hypothetical protein